jgi:hypothetical protein
MNKLLKYIILFLCSVGMLISCGGGGGGGGGNCSATSPCQAGQFCHFTDLSCGDGGAAGSCETVPTNCEASEINVCSCESLTFFNECFANAASQSVRGPGECA